MEPGLLRTTGTLTSVLGDSLITYGYRTHVNKTLEEDNRIELSPCKQWDGFQDRVRAMQPIFHYSLFITI